MRSLQWYKRGAAYHSCYVFSKNFYYNEKNGYLLPENKDFLYVFVAYFRLLIASFCFLLVFL